MRLAYVNLLCEDMDSLSAFYMRLFGFPEIETHRSPIYRCLNAGDVELGFNSPLARKLLGLASPHAANRPAAGIILTFEMDEETQIERLSNNAVALGGKVIKLPYDTYYNARQCVLADPEGNVFRLNFRRGPRMPAEAVESPPWKV